MLADLSWWGLLRRRSRPVRVEPRVAGRTTARFDPDKLHPTWRPGAGFEFRLGDGPGTPVTLDGLRAHIAAARVVHGDDEADRLQAELDDLLAIKHRYELATSAGAARDAAEGP